MTASTNGWQKLEATFGGGPGAGWSYGFIGLATDRACEHDVRAFLPDDETVELFGVRVPMATVATNETLAALSDHVGEAARNIMPWGRLDAIGFGCTSGSVAVGTSLLARKINAEKPGVPVVNPVDGAIEALRLLGASRIALLTPYQAGPSALIENYFGESGLEAVTKASFFLDGDPDMNRVSAECLIEAGAQLGSHRQAEALFISCTGLVTHKVIAPLEARLGKPVVTSNQALTWGMLRAAGDRRPLKGRGRLFELAPAKAKAAE
ncbi:MAG: aspartate/glutamate racemase family protein [Hyphomicrobiaceae bacterium]